MQNITFTNEKFKEYGLNFNWNDLFFAFKNNWIHIKEVEDYTTNYLIDHPNCNDKKILELAEANFNNLDNLIVEQYLNELTDKYDEKAASKRWLFVVLSFLFFENLDSDNKLFEIQKIYADFNYSEEIKSFVPYMPPEDSYNPKIHTHEENVARLMNLWNEYLKKTKLIICDMKST